MPCQLVTQYEEVSTHHVITGDSVFAVYMYSGLTSPYLCLAPDWCQGTLPREGEGSSGPPSQSLCSSLLTQLCVLSLGSASLDSAAHSPAGPGRLLTWLVLGPGHLESAIQWIMSGDAGCEQDMAISYAQS